MFDTKKLFSQLASQLGSMATPTAVEMVNSTRAQSTKAIEMITHAETKAAVTKIVTLQYTLADMFASFIDKAVETARESQFGKA